MPANIFVLAGVNGAGKSSIGGAALLMRQVPYFNPDIAARTLLDSNPGVAWWWQTLTPGNVAGKV